MTTARPTSATTSADGSASGKLPKYYRKGHIIRTVERDETGKIVSHQEEAFMGARGHKHSHLPSISAAKRASRKLQNGSHGLLQVVDRFPKML